MKEGITRIIRPFLRVPLTGLDLSDRTGKFLQFSLAPRGRLFVEKWGSFTVPEGLIQEGEIKREDDLAAFLKTWLRAQAKSVQRSFFALSLPEEKSFLRIIQIPKVQERIIAQAIRWEIEGHVPLSREEIAYDYEIIEPLRDHLDHQDVLVIAYPKAAVESYVRVCRGAGIRLSALEPESQAIARSIIPLMRDRAVRILVDMGRLRTSVTLFAGGTLFFTTTIQLGGSLFEENIAKALGVPREKAEELKKETGLERKGTDARVYEALAPSISVLADEIQKAMAYYREHPEHMHGAEEEVGALYLTGGDANLLGLDVYLSTVLKVPVQRGDPFSPIQGMLASSVPPMPRSQAFEFSTAVGLALRDIRTF